MASMHRVMRAWSIIQAKGYLRKVLKLNLHKAYIILGIIALTSTFLGAM